jgi:type IV pilus assembly protein PilM
MNFFNLEPETFGLDISDLSLKIIKFKKKGRNLKLASYLEKEIQPGIIEEGEIKKEEALAEIIKEAISQVKGEKLKTKYVVASLPEEKSFVQIINLPLLAEEELAKAIGFELENYIPLASEEVYFDFQTVKPLFDHLDHLDVLLVALPKKIVDSYTRVLKKAGLIPLALEVESQAICRALIKNEVSFSPVLIVDFGATRTGFIIFAGYSLRFTSSIPVSSQKLTEAIAKNLNIPLTEAEVLKRKHGLRAIQEIHLKRRGANSDKMGFEKEVIEDRKIVDALIGPIIDLTEQIKNRLDYYQTHPFHEHLREKSKSSPLNKIEKIILCGGGANLKDLTNVLSLGLKIPVELGNPWTNVFLNSPQEIPDISYQESLKYTTAIGLALRSSK